MNKTTLKLFAIGVVLIANGMIYFIAPDFLYNSVEFKQVLIALLSVLIVLMVVNVWLGVKSIRQKKVGSKDKV